MEQVYSYNPGGRTWHRTQVNLVRALMTAHTADSMFHVLTLCTLHIVFTITITTLLYCYVIPASV